MSKIGIYYGSTTGNTQEVAEEIAKTALDFYYENGYFDSREEAKNSLFPNNSPGTFTNTSNNSSKNLKI